MTSHYVSARTFLTDAECRSLSPAHARVLKSFAGRVRMLAELVTGGAVPDDEEPPVITRNPQGLYGLDFSGPPWGSAFRHPIAFAIDAHDMDWAGVPTPNPVPFLYPIAVYCRPHAERANAPYSRGYLSFVARLSSAGSVNVTTSIYKVPVSGRRSFLGSETESVTSTTPAWVNLSDVFLPLNPGFNRFELALDIDTDSPEVIVSDFSVNQVVKRKHT